MRKLKNVSFKGEWNEELQKTGIYAGDIITRCDPCPNSKDEFFVVVGNPLNKGGRQFFEYESGGISWTNELIYDGGEIISCVSEEEAKELSEIFKRRYAK
jgi:hypothetical protein